ncbi:carboxypeptidase-like regulatory domain-containing protein [Chungangia koreensis]|uniref:Carboxypeptidase-like regulatory domain-containing protein n=1 Tax=Chungangia koreensis TaxID=752657 RepID=A0ABV8X8S2_9LACT
MMKKISLLLVALVLAIVLTACNDEIGEPSLELSNDALTIANWEMDHSHYEEVKGKLLVGENPVVGANVQISNKRTIETDENGEFHFNVDRSVLDVKNIEVVSVNEATINGESIDEETAKSLVGTKEQLSVQFPLAIDKVVASEENTDLVEVHARAIMEENQEYPSFGPSKYRVAGNVKDADGNPVEGATVNLRRDGVEGFSMSDPSNENGEYAMYYLPEDDENHYFYVHYNGLKYTLPNNKAFLFPEDIGVDIQITLPKEGTIIQDSPPTLVAKTAPGAVYKGTLIGLDVDKDVEYSVTIPKKDGTFVVTLPKEEWEKSPTFFETDFSAFYEEDLTYGDIIPMELLTHKENEPSGITASEK